MITQSISTNVFISTIMFFLIIVLFRKSLIGEKLNKNEIIIMPLLFFIWFGGYKIISDLYLNENINNVLVNISTTFIFLTVLYLIAAVVFIFFQDLKLLNIIYLTSIYLVLSLISIYF